MAELLTIVVEFDAKEMQDELKRIDARLDPNILDPLVAESALVEVKENYGKIDPDGNALRGLSREYARRKAQDVGGKSILHYSERLWQSLGYTEDGYVGALSDPGYAAAVNSDREFLGVPEDWLSRADDKLLEYVDTGEGLPL